MYEFDEGLLDKEADFGELLVGPYCDGGAKVSFGLG